MRTATATQALIEEALRAYRADQDLAFMRNTVFTCSYCGNQMLYDFNGMKYVCKCGNYITEEWLGENGGHVSRGGEPRDLPGSVFRNQFGIECTPKWWMFRMPETSMEKRRYFFLPDEKYSGTISGNVDNFIAFKRLCLEFKRLGGHLLYIIEPSVSNPISCNSGTVFIDDLIPDENIDEARDLFEGENYQTKELTIVNENHKGTTIK